MQQQSHCIHKSQSINQLKEAKKQKQVDIILQSKQQQEIIKLQEQKLNKSQYVAKKFYEVVSGMGKLMIEINAFKGYYWIIVSICSQLKVDPYAVEVILKAPDCKYSPVISLSGQNASHMCRILGQHCKKSVVLSLNFENEITAEHQYELVSILTKLI